MLFLITNIIYSTHTHVNRFLRPQKDLPINNYVLSTCFSMIITAPVVCFKSSTGGKQTEVIYVPVQINVSGSQMTALLSGEIDHHTAAGMRMQIDEHLQRRRPDTLILDFGEITFMDSSGVGLIMGRYKLMRELGGTIRIQNTSSSASRMLRLAGLERLGIKL